MHPIKLQWKLSDLLKSLFSALLLLSFLCGFKYFLSQKNHNSAFPVFTEPSESSLSIEAQSISQFEFDKLLDFWLTQEGKYEFLLEDNNGFYKSFHSVIELKSFHHHHSNTFKHSTLHVHLSKKDKKLYTCLIFDKMSSITVSYTHLTLPTILLV